MEAEPRPTPKKLADFDVVRRLGAGGMAEVFLAKKRGAEATYKLLVLKRILPAHGSSPRFKAMFAEEAQLATRLNHPNIVQVYDFQDYGDEGQLLSMEYVEGPDLKELSRAVRQQETRLMPYVSAYIVAEVARGLHYAHERRDEGGSPLEIVHRDVSPQNILLSYDGTVKIADFGIATANLFRQETGVLKGKTAYMSPEQARGEKVDRRTDIYSLGVVFHELLTGRQLHSVSEGKELLEAVRLGVVEPPSTFVRGIPEELEAIVMQALSVQRERRFSTAREMASAITKSMFQTQEPVDAHALELVIAQFIHREEHSPDDLVEARGAGSVAFSASASHSSTGTSSNTGQDPAQRSLKSREGREVRNVAIVGLRLHGRQALEAAIGASATVRLLEQLRSTFSEIAYKRGTQWVWGEDPHPGSPQPSNFPEPGPPLQSAPRQSDSVQPNMLSQQSTPERHSSPSLPAEESVPASQKPVSSRGVDIRLSEGRAVVGLMANPARAASDASWLAVDVHEALAGACDGLPVQLTASVAIARGIAEGKREREGHLRQPTLQPPAVALSQLLAARAPSGSTWVAGGVYRLVRRDFVWAELPMFELGASGGQALPSSMRVYQLSRPLTRDERQQQQSLAPRDLVGRDAELAELHSAYHQAVSQMRGNQVGQVTARLVVGEMGIGKTALVTTFLTELPPDTQELRVECSPYRNEVPYSSAGQWLRELTGIRVDEPLEQAKGAIVEVIKDLAERESSHELIRLMSELAVGHVIVAADEAEALGQRRLLAQGIGHFFAKAASRGPLVVAVDRMQWIDVPSLLLLRDLLDRAELLPILVLLVTRPDDRLTNVLENIVRIDLSGLAPDHLVRLVEAHIGASEGVADACAELIPRASGNPFFLLEMVDALLERGKFDLLEAPSGKVSLVGVALDGQDVSLPSTLEQLIADRLNELSSAERGVVDWLCVSGGPLGREDLAALLEGETDEAVARLCARGLCDFTLDAVELRHPLTRDVAYAALAEDERAYMHQRLGERLAEGAAARGLGAALVARHLERGKKPQQAAGFFLEAAAVARRSFQLQLAIDYYLGALDVLPVDDPRRLEPLSELETIARLQGRWRERKQYLTELREAARRSASVHWIATALLRHAQFDVDGGHLKEGLHLAELCERIAHDGNHFPLEAQAQSQRAQILRDTGDMKSALAACQIALETVQHRDVPLPLRAEVLGTQASLLLRVGKVSDSINALAEAIAIFRESGARRQEARAKSALAYSVYVDGHYEDAISLAFDAIRLDLSIGGRFQMAKTLANIAQCFARLGVYSKAENYFSRAREAHERYEDHDSRAETMLRSAEMFVELGRLDEADALLAEAERESDLESNSYDAVHVKLLQAFVARARGNAASAILGAFDARLAAEQQAYVSFHFLAMALEAAVRVDVGEHHVGALLATTTLGAIEAVQGAEYGIETRALCLDALARTGAGHIGDLRRHAADYVARQQGRIRDLELRRSFSERDVVRKVVEAVEANFG
jgi:eukaryotic-like serine/threonine-protein kinase